MQTDEIRAGAVDGRSVVTKTSHHLNPHFVTGWCTYCQCYNARLCCGYRTGGRGDLPGLGWLRSFQDMADSALAGTLLFEGRSLAALCRDPEGQKASSGLAIQSSEIAKRYG